jgi:hypothetical protein
MRLTSAHKFAIGIVAIVVLMFLAGTLLDRAKRNSEPAPKAGATASAPAALPSVQVVETQESLHPYMVRVRGRTEAARTVTAPLGSGRLRVRATEPSRSRSTMSL